MMIDVDLFMMGAVTCCMVTVAVGDTLETL